MANWLSSLRNVLLFSGALFLALSGCLEAAPGTLHYYQRLGQIPAAEMDSDARALFPEEANLMLEVAFRGLDSLLPAEREALLILPVGGNTVVVTTRNPISQHSIALVESREALDAPTNTVRSLARQRVPVIRALLHRLLFPTETSQTLGLVSRENAAKAAALIAAAREDSAARVGEIVDLVFLREVRRSYLLPENNAARTALLSLYYSLLRSRPDGFWGPNPREAIGLNELIDDIELANEARSLDLLLVTARAALVRQMIAGDLAITPPGNPSDPLDILEAAQPLANLASRILSSYVYIDITRISGRGAWTSLMATWLDTMNTLYIRQTLDERTDINLVRLVADIDGDLHRLVDGHRELENPEANRGDIAQRLLRASNSLLTTLRRNEYMNTLTGLPCEESLL